MKRMVPLRISGYGFFILLLLMSTSSCGGGSAQPSHHVSDVGAVALQLKFGTVNETGDRASASRMALEPNVCDDYLIDRIYVDVLRASDDSVVIYADRDCIAGSLTIDNVPAGVDLYVRCRGMVAQKGMLWEGVSQTFKVESGQTRVIEPVSLEYQGTDEFSLAVDSTSPADNANDVAIGLPVEIHFNQPLAPSSVADDTLILRKVDGTTVPGAVAYDPTTHTIRLMPFDELEELTTYNCSLTASDNNHVTDTAGRAYIGDFVWQFTTNRNHAPIVKLTSPDSSHVSFKEGENIIFSASASDAEDGQLTGEALVWSSNVDGPIGSGETLITSALSPGTHDISLTATDSRGIAVTSKLPTITVASTRFIKMGTQTAGVPDASNAFDGDLQTSATLMTPQTEFIHFKAYLGGADAFIFKIKVGSSTPGSSIDIQTLSTVGDWQTASDIVMGEDKTVVVKVANAQNYKGDDGYINLRACWKSGASGGFASIFEIWRVDPAYNRSETSQNVVSPESAFDNDSSTYATVPALPALLNFKAYLGQAQSVVFKMLLIGVGGSRNMLFIEAETTENNLTVLQLFDLAFASTQTKTITFTVQNAQSYLDEDGYINLRALWTMGTTSTALKIQEIWRHDAFNVGPKTTIGVIDAGCAVDSQLNTSALITNYWGEDGKYDFLHLNTYIGDADVFTFYINVSQPIAGSKLVIDAELAPDKWWTIRGIRLDTSLVREGVTITNVHDYTNSDGFISLRAKWESELDSEGARINEIWQERN